jgi:hypothetical protein
MAKPDVRCEVAGCSHAAFVRIGWAKNGHHPTEADMCEAHAREHWERSTGGVSSLGIPSPTYGPPGVVIFPESFDVIRQRTLASARDDNAACRGL